MKTHKEQIYTLEELKVIQKIELEALKKIIEVCSKLDIQYFVVSGTALGTIRHGGFIPWDDDIDIGMTRENYTKFINEASNLLAKGYTLQCPYNKSNSPYPYTKVRVDETKFIEYSNRELDIHHGIYVDIFPFDEVPDEEKLHLNQYKSARRWIEFYRLKQNPDITYPPMNIKDKMKSILRHFIYYLLKIFPQKIILSKIETITQKYNDKKQSAYECLYFSEYKTNYLLKSTLYPLKKHKFEDIEVYVPNNCEIYLTTHYGNYMELPPEEKRFGHKPFIVKY